MDDIKIKLHPSYPVKNKPLVQCIGELFKNDELISKIQLIQPLSTAKHSIFYEIITSLVSRLVNYETGQGIMIQNTPNDIKQYAAKNPKAKRSLERLFKTLGRKGIFLKFSD